METETDNPGNWISWNWKWLLPVALLLGLALIAAVLLVTTSAMKTSFPYQEGLARAKADSRVMTALGSPLTTGFFVTGSVKETGSSGTASLQIPITGPKGNATLAIEAEKILEIWNFKSLAIELDDAGRRIDLLSGN